MKREMKGQLAALIGVLLMVLGLAIYHPEPAEAGSGDLIITHASNSERASLWVCRDWQGYPYNRCKPGTSYAYISRGNSTRWDDVDAVNVPDRCNVQMSNGAVLYNTGWVKASGGYTSTARRTATVYCD